MTKAEKVASFLNDDGTKFETENGLTLDDLALKYGAKKQCVEPVGKDEYRGVPCSHITSRTIVRYKFSDGSAIVVAGDAWDFEGDKPFSWAGV